MTPASVSNLVDRALEVAREVARAVAGFRRPGNSVLSVTGPPEGDVTALARQIAETGARERSRVFHLSFWSDRVLDWAMAHPDFKTQLFRFVDVFPATRDDADVQRHMEEYFAEVDLPHSLELGIDAAHVLPFGRSVEVAVARRNILRMAAQFIVGASPADAVAPLHQLWRHGSAFTIDLLGEKTVTESEADNYASRVTEMVDVLADATAEWHDDAHLERDDLGRLPRVNVSIKPTALTPKFTPLTSDLALAEARARLRPVLRAARDRDAFVNFDMEHYDVKDLTLRLFRSLLDEDEFADLDAGIAVQAYLRDSYRDLLELTRWSAQRKRPVTVRLVKGAYWDTETVLARAQHWHLPVFVDKSHTDTNFDRCARLLHDNHGSVRSAFGTHNLRSLAYAITYARHLGIPDSGYEIQMLHGMAEPIQAAIRRLGFRLRVYAPVGDLLPGMAYLVRRLLENTSNESFVRHRFAEGRDLDELLSPPRVETIPGPPPAVARPCTRTGELSPYAPEPTREWRRADVRDAFARMLAAVAERLADTPLDVPGHLAGESLFTGDALQSTNPADPTSVVAISSSCNAEHADAAVSVAQSVLGEWASTRIEERAQILFDAAEWLRARRDELAALVVLEAGKPWNEADADVCEAIDFCEYYGREMIRLAGGGRVSSPPGEHNRLTYAARGITAVISPWNFPLAIPCGMTAAALVAGNPVILKPAEQTPGLASELVAAFEESGVPGGVLQLLPGRGEDVGAALVAHPATAVLAFTGSKEVGLRIIREAAEHRPGQRTVKKVVAEMGGKNALLIDADADPDQAVPATVYSAFGYSGQKCSAASRVIVVDSVFDSFVARLVAAAGELTIGPPADPSTQVGPLIDQAAQQRSMAYIERAFAEGSVLLHREDIPAHGWYVGPTIVTGVAADSAIAREEIFGPVLTVLRVADFDEAIRVANATDFALTAGVFSRSPSHIRRAARELRAGNVYVNRHTTAAVVGRQPFGGYGLSGVGSKAGGPDYLQQFLNPRVVSENTLRQGFAPE
ncbi:MAG: 1-pyrroline-5-carboxylate dehydrogenase [Acidimicrobiales bacterium]|nr:1-pyrroline-5-carboxylate dehydrogenase [Acidimicrobiales bacterium]